MVNFHVIQQPTIKTMKFFFVVYPLFVILFSFSSCGKAPEDELNKKINIALRNDNKIDEKEWTEFSVFILVNKQEFTNLISDDKNINAKELTSFILDIAHKRRSQVDPEIFNPTKENKSSVNEEVKIFIENSGSMDGYVLNTTEFEAALSDLLVQIQYHYNNENLKVNFINTKVYPSQLKEVNDFVTALEPSKAPYNVGNRTVSKLNEILKIILDSTRQDNISIFVSDCIYSLESNKDTEGALEFQKSLTKGAFLQKSKEFDFATIILKMNSKFNGKYWKKDNTFEQLTNSYRPYYIWFVGSNELLNGFANKINLKDLKGFKNSYFLSNANSRKTPFFTVLKETNKVGSFKQADRDVKDVKSIKGVEFEGGTLQFSIAIDLSNIPVDSAYLTTLKNYVVPDGFTVKSIEKIDRNKLSQRDFVTVEKSPATHFITVSTTSKFTVQDLKLELSNRIPEWIKESSTPDDRDIKNKLDKTFGLSYLVEGVSEAYATQNPEQTSYFKITVTIKK